MGTAFVTVAGQHGNNAENFYRMFPAESVLPNPQILQIDNVVRVSRPSLYTLLREIAIRRDREVVVVSHGSSIQLAIRVMQGINIGLDTSFINAILGPDSNADLARRLGTSASNVAGLRDRIQRVQQLGLMRLEFRACRVGQSQPMLEALKRLFQAGSVCGPRLFDSYGPISNVRPTDNSHLLAQWQSSHPGHQTFGTSPERFFWVNDGSVDPPVISHVFAESWNGVRRWVEAKFPSGANHRFRQGTFYYHFQVAMLPTSSLDRGSRTFDSNFVFPNDSGYRQNLVAVQSPSAQPASTTGSARKSRGPGPMGLNTRNADLYTPGNASTLLPRQQQSNMPGPEGLRMG